MSGITVNGIFTMPDGSEEIRLQSDTGEIYVHNFPTSELLQAWIYENLTFISGARKTSHSNSKRMKSGN